MAPSVASPQALGTTVTWSAKATDTNSNNLTFQFSVTAPSGTVTMVKDLTSASWPSGTWTSQPFVWTTIAGEGNYTIQVSPKILFRAKAQPSPTLFASTPALVAVRGRHRLQCAGGAV